MAFKVGFGLLSASLISAIVGHYAVQHPWLVAVWLTVIVIGGFLFSNHLSLGARELYFGVVQMANGHLDYRIKINGRDEIAEIASEFNKLATSLLEHRQNLEKRIMEIEALYNVASALGQSLDLERVLHRLLQKVIESTGVELGMVYLSGKEGLVLYSHYGLSPDVIENLMAVDQECSLVKVAALTEKRVIWRRASKDPGDDRPAREFQDLDSLLAEINSSVAVPILSQSELIGVMVFGQKSDAEFTERDLEFLDTVSSKLGSVIENAFLFEKTKLQERDLRHLTVGILKAQEQGMKRLSRELHDQVGQALGGVKLNLEVMRRNLSSLSVSDLATKLDESVALVMETMGELRRIVAELRPSVLEDLGLPQAIEWYLGSFSERSGIRVEFEITAMDKEISSEVETALFRILQEACTNIVKHAQCQMVKVGFFEDQDFLYLTIGDDGVGFNSEEKKRSFERKGIGLIGINERVNILGGTFLISSSPGKGTYLEVRVPMQNAIVASGTEGSWGFEKHQGLAG